MKRLLVGTVLCLALAVVPASAGDDKTISITLDAWAADVGGLFFLGAQDETCPGLTGCGTVTQGIMSLDDAGTVPAFAVSWVNGSGSGVTVSYYDVDEMGPFSSLLTDDNSTFARAHEENFFSDHGDWWEGAVGLEMSNVSVEWTHTTSSSDKGSWQVSFGINNVDYEQTDQQFMNNLHDFGFQPNETSREYGITIVSEFEGIGPSVGFSGNQKLGDSGLEFIGNVKFSVLVGDSDISYTSFFDPTGLSAVVNPTSMVAGDLDGDGFHDIFGPVNDPDLDFTFNTDGTAFSFDTTIGLTYGFDFGLSLRLGYRAAMHQNMPTLDINDDLLIGEQFDTRDVTLSGVFFGAGWTF